MPVTPVTLAKYSAAVFVETGTYYGEGIEAALAAGFPRVVSIELDAHLVALATAKFAFNPAVQVYQGSSDAMLDVILKKFAVDVTLFLDAHAGGDLTIYNCPLVKEVRAALDYSKRFPITILIDDVRLMEPALLELLQELLLNGGYRISRESSPVAKDDILVATK